MTTGYNWCLSVSLKIPSLLIFTNFYPSSQVKILPSVKPCPSLRPRYEDSELRRFNASSQRPLSPSSRICLTDQWTNAIWQPTTEKSCVSFEICEIGDFGIFCDILGYFGIFLGIFWVSQGILPFFLYHLYPFLNRVTLASPQRHQLWMMPWPKLGIFAPTSLTRLHIMLHLLSPNLKQV